MSVISTSGAIPSVSMQKPSSAAANINSSLSPTVDYQQFLTLLVAELKNQDPINPANPTEFVSQLASFSAVEQQVRTNSTLDSLLAAQAGSLIGKTVTSADGTISGKVTAVTTSYAGDTTVELSNGKSLVLGDGITVRA